jgi:hypothetical protein
MGSLWVTGLSNSLVALALFVAALIIHRMLSSFVVACRHVCVVVNALLQTTARL